MQFYIGCGMVLAQGDKFVLVQESRGDSRRGLYNLPGGTLEAHEDLLQCVRREVLEETGVAVEPEALVTINHLVLEGGHNVLFFIFAGQVKPDAVFHSGEHEVIQALSYKQIVDLDKQGLLRAPSVIKGINDYRAGIRHPLTLIDAHHASRMAAVTVSK